MVPLKGDHSVRARISGPNGALLCLEWAYSCPPYAARRTGGHPYSLSLARLVTISRRRAAVFIDYQNCYGWARRAFFADGDPQVHGHFNPRRFAEMLAAKAEHLEVVYAGVYCGLPHPDKDPRSHAARSKQIAAWESQGATVVARPLRYPHGWRLGGQIRPIEKGIDVKLAIDAVMLALRGDYDVGILASCDTDLVPVLEAVIALGRDAVLEESVIETEVDADGSVRELVGLKRLSQSSLKVEIEVIGWAGTGTWLSASEEKVPVRWVGQKDFKAVQDHTVYG